MLTRSGVAKRLGKSIATVRRMEAEELHPVRDACGVLQFSEEEVERLAQSRSTSLPPRHGIALSRPAWADGYEAALDEQARELEELRTLTVQLGAARDSERTRWAADLHEMREQAKTAAQLAKEREQDERAERGERNVWLPKQSNDDCASKRSTSSMV
jgi:hypothetical protein